ncbi:hypothetical protein TSOC_010821 [Tetrabaena socialis]|uniref:Uncharacterized protein n=1 Tax=Tetrabaena socialis TaxID=47790 RepID=A0A2J7ZSA5_9CHLO|nr:hypothetical protein TSOC_010821 [Tetrabaena socialis]|eukprot:PNH03145.1 hypothetical protein TSOC_010821 [Tetrabaena socialis]
MSLVQLRPRPREGAPNPLRQAAGGPPCTTTIAAVRRPCCQGSGRSNPSQVLRRHLQRPLPAAHSRGDSGSHRGADTVAAASSSAPPSLTPLRDGAAANAEPAGAGPSTSADPAAAAAALRRPRIRSRPASSGAIRAGSVHGSSDGGVGSAAVGAGSSGVSVDALAGSASDAEPSGGISSATDNGDQPGAAASASGGDGKGNASRGGGDLGARDGAGAPGRGDGTDGATTTSARGGSGGSSDSGGAGGGGSGGGSSGGGVPYTFAEEPPLDLRSCRHFVNLTNGIEALPVLDQLGLPYRCATQQYTCRAGAPSSTPGWGKREC